MLESPNAKRLGCLPHIDLGSIAHLRWRSLTSELRPNAQPNALERARKHGTGLCSVSVDPIPKRKGYSPNADLGPIAHCTWQFLPAVNQSAHRWQGCCRSAASWSPTANRCLIRGLCRVEVTRLFPWGAEESEAFEGGPAPRSPSRDLLLPAAKSREVPFLIPHDGVGGATDEFGAVLGTSHLIGAALGQIPPLAPELLHRLSSLGRRHASGRYTPLSSQRVWTPFW